MTQEDDDLKAYYAMCDEIFGPQLERFRVRMDALRLKYSFTLPTNVKTISISGTISADNPTGPSPAKVGTSKAGVNDARKVPCSKSKHHGFRPANEPCPMCDPDVAGPAEWVWSNGTLVFT